MSTIAKLDPSVRQARADRRDTRRSLDRVIGFMSVQPTVNHLRLALAGITADTLRDITRNPRPTGATKSRLFANLIRLLQEPSNASSTAQPSAS